MGPNIAALFCVPPTAKGAKQMKAEAQNKFLFTLLKTQTSPGIAESINKLNPKCFAKQRT